MGWRQSKFANVVDRICGFDGWVDAPAFITLTSVELMPTIDRAGASMLLRRAAMYETEVSGVDDLMKSLDACKHRCVDLIYTSLLTDEVIDSTAARATVDDFASCTVESKLLYDRTLRDVETDDATISKALVDFRQQFPMALKLAKVANAASSALHAAFLHYPELSGTYRKQNGNDFWWKEWRMREYLGEMLYVRIQRSAKGDGWEIYKPKDEFSSTLELLYTNDNPSAYYDCPPFTGWEPRFRQQDHQGPTLSF
ncbi:MAG: hypothetical protein SGARI_006888 [Bacillariaceae sp.]